MGYTTEFTGFITVTPPLNADEIAYINKFSDTRRMHRKKGPYYVLGTGDFGQGHDADILDFNKPDPTQPGLWCQWVASEDGTQIRWNEAEKFYNAEEWMRYLIDHFLGPNGVGKGIHQHTKGAPKFTFVDHILNGTILAQGEDEDDKWVLGVIGNTVIRTEGHADAPIIAGAQTIVVSGNPVDGLCFHGPFDTSDEATEWAEGYIGEDWWIAALEKRPD